MTTFRRLGAHLLVFVLLLAGFVATGLWHYLDYFVYRTVYFDAAPRVQLADHIVLIDLPYRSDVRDNDPTEYRLRLAELLGAIAASPRDRPQVVILDIWFSNDGRGLRELQDAITRLRARPAGPVDVYASFNPHAEDRREAGELWGEHAQELYRHALTGYGHTSLDLFMGVLSYEPELQIPAQDGSTEFIMALPVKVARDLGRLDDPADGEALVLPVGNERAVDDRTIAFVHDRNSTSNGRFMASRHSATPAAPNLDRKIVIIGSLSEDRYREAPQAGPKLIAWALTDRMKGEGLARRPLNHPALVLGQVLSFALFTVLVFALLFKYAPRVQTRPALTAGLSSGASTGALVMAAAGALTLKYVLPVGLTVFAIGLAGTLAWSFAQTFLVTGVAEGSDRYDAFISYSRQHSEWVVTHVYEPLKATRKADGTELAIFFDRTEIGLGEAFTARYMWAIVESRCFIAIFSDNYYTTNHTRNEMDVAYKRSVEKKILLVPVVHTSRPVPEIYAHLNYVDATANPGFIEDVRKVVIGAGS